MKRRLTNGGQHGRFVKLSPSDRFLWERAGEIMQLRWVTGFRWMVSLMTLHLSWKKEERKITVAVHMTTKPICLCHSVRLSVFLSVSLSVFCLCHSVCLSVCLPLSVFCLCLSVSLFSFFLSLSIFPVSVISVSFMCLSFFCLCLSFFSVSVSACLSFFCLCVCLLVSLLSHTVALMCCLYVTYCLMCRSHIFVLVTTLVCPSCHHCNYTEMYYFLFRPLSAIQHVCLKWVLCVRPWTKHVFLWSPSLCWAKHVLLWSPIRVEQNTFWWWWCRTSRPRMSVDTLETNCDQCRRMVQCCFTSTETVRLIRTESPGRPPRFYHSSWTLNVLRVLVPLNAVLW